jgi:hypothetical protein
MSSQNGFVEGGELSVVLEAFRADADRFVLVERLRRLEACKASAKKP